MEFTFHGVIDSNKHYTAVGILNESTKEMKVGVSVCSLNDQYNRKKGLMIARGRANKNPLLNIVLPTMLFKQTKFSKEVANYFIEKITAEMPNILKTLQFRALKHKEFVKPKM